MSKAVQALARLRLDSPFPLPGLGDDLAVSDRGRGVLKVEADRYTKACQNSYLNPHPVPPRTIAARRIAPAMDPIMILVPLGPAQRKEGGRRVRRRRWGGGRNKTTPLKTHVRGQHQHRTSTTSTREREKGRWQDTCRHRKRDEEKEKETSTWGGGGRTGG